jgi:hypothetical protein
LSDLQKRVSDNGERIRRKHLWEALFLPICCAFAGEYFLDKARAWANTGVGALAGFDHIRRASDLVVADLEEARNEMPDMETIPIQLGVYGILSIAEKTTARPDPDVRRKYPNWPR